MKQYMYAVLETIDGRGKVYCLAADRQSAEKFICERVLQCVCNLAYQDIEGGFILTGGERVFECLEVTL